MSDRRAKQVIVMRTDLNMRRGKMVAQGAHASLGVLLGIEHPDSHPITWDRDRMTSEQSRAITEWLKGSFAKVCVGVPSEGELMRVYAEAVDANLPTKLITDAGHTEFHGVPTRTCLAIGPCWADEVDRITGELRLL